MGKRTQEFNGGLLSLYKHASMSLTCVWLFLFSGYLEVESFSQSVCEISVKLPFKKTIDFHVINSPWE